MSEAVIVQADQRREICESCQCWQTGEYAGCDLLPTDKLRPQKMKARWHSPHGECLLVQIGQEPLWNSGELEPKEEKVNTKEVREAAEHLGVTWEDARRYARALIKWRKKGYPCRTRKNVNKIMRKHCGPCEHNIDGRCRKCRCKVNKGRFPLTNKIKMATEHCLLGNW